MKKCSNCQSSNTDGAKFCSNCGQPQSEPVLAVSAVQQATRTAQTSTAPTSSNLGKCIPSALITKLETDRSNGGFHNASVFGERRIVTMVFFDIQGSTAAENLNEADQYIDERQMKHFIPLVVLASGKFHHARGKITVPLEQF